MKALCGNEKTSDAVVTVDLDSVGIEIEINSKLKNMFGKLMINAVEEALNEMNLKNAKIVVDDFGALDFVIKARTKTALRRAIKMEGNI
jgi:citrate lyase subunit gamma (acyl carrier protein)